MVRLTANQVDALAVGFTVFASIWLVITLVYMVTVCLFFRMRNRGYLRGSMSDPAWGRAYLFGSSQYYIPMGWLFRRYVMHQRTGEERERIARIRVMSVDERREAIKEILQPVTDPSPSPANTKTIMRSCSHESSSSNHHVAPTSSQEHVIKSNGTSIHALADSSTDFPICSVNDVLDIEEAGGHDSLNQDDECMIEANDNSPTDGSNHGLVAERPYYEFHLHSPSTDNISGDSQSCVSCTQSGGSLSPSTGPVHSSLVSNSTSPASPNKDNQVVSQNSNLIEASSLASSSEDHAECPICFVGHSPGQTWFQSPKCAHRFHWDCILSWLEIQSHRDCPCCRTEILPEEQIWQVVQRQRKERRRKKRTAKQLRKPTEANDAPIQRGATEDEDDEVDDTAFVIHAYVSTTTSNNESSPGERRGSTSELYSEISFEHNIAEETHSSLQSDTRGAQQAEILQSTTIDETSIETEGGIDV